MAALLLVAGAFAILSLPSRPEAKTKAAPVAGPMPANPGPPAQPPSRVQPARPKALAAKSPKRTRYPPPASPPQPVKPAAPSKAVNLLKRGAAAPVEQPAASAKCIVKRRRVQTEDELRRQLETVREVRLDRTPRLRESTEVIALSKRAAAARKPVETVARMVATRADLDGLPFRMGEECHLSPGRADDLEGDSVALRIYLTEVASLRPRAKAAGADIRPDPTYLQRRLRAAGDRRHKWLEPAAIPALQQLLMAEDESIRTVLVDQLAHIDGKAASIALAQRALYDLNFEVRKRALEALSRRPPHEYRDELLKGFNYPWEAVADHAAEALAALKMHDTVPALIRLLDRPGPSAPFVKPKKRACVRELVRINHLRNCLLCHAVSLDRAGKVRGRVPPTNEPLPLTFTREYYEANTGLFVRADVTYLRQDFSVPLRVSNQTLWPAVQRFDFLVRERPATPADQLANPRPGVVTERHKAIFFALRELTGTDAGPSPEDWKRLVLHHGP